MRAPLLLCLSLGLGCGDDGATPIDGGVDSGPDAPPSTCQTQGAIGQFIRRAGNPRVVAGATPIAGKLDVDVTGPDVHWDGAMWVAYWAARHGDSPTDPALAGVIRRATSTDRTTWTIAPTPAFAPSTSSTAWDRVAAVAPTVVYNPAAPADRRYLMLYAGSDGAFPHPGYDQPRYQIGAAFSADGLTFTRVPAAMSPHGEDGLVLTAGHVYPTGSDGILADPDVVLVDGIYHLYFSSFSCGGADCTTTQTMGVAHATSTDGISWTIEEAPVRSLLRTSALTSGGQQPSVIYDPIHCKWELWLRNDLAGATDAQPVDVDNMAGVYKAESTDGESWSVNYAFARDFAWNATEGGEGLGLVTGADVGTSGSGRLMLYVGLDDENVPAGFVLPNRTGGGTRPGVFTLNVATRDLP